MERIKLAKEEKEALRILHEGKINMTTDPQRIGSLSYGFEALERLGLARCAWTEGHAIEDVQLQAKGDGMLTIIPNCGTLLIGRKSSQSHRSYLLS